MQLNGPFRRLGFTFIPDTDQQTLPTDSTIEFDGFELHGHTTDAATIASPQKAAFNFGFYCRCRLPRYGSGVVIVDAIAENDPTGDCKINIGELYFNEGGTEWRPWREGDTVNPLIPALKACRLVAKTWQTAPADAFRFAEQAIVQTGGDFHAA